MSSRGLGDVYNRQFIFFILFISGCCLNNESLGPTEEQKEEIAQRIAPIGTIVMFGDTSSVVEESISMDIQKVSLSPGPEHTVKMLNAGVDGSMVFEPAVLRYQRATPFISKLWIYLITQPV